MVPLLYVELVAAVENPITLEEEICLCSMVGDHIGLCIRKVEPIPPMQEQS